MQQFKVAARRTEPIPFTIEGDDHVYQFVPPKRAAMVLDAVGVNASDDDAVANVIRQQFDWLGDGLGEEQAARIETRLRDPNDDLDVDVLQELLKWLLEQASGRPTTPPSD